MWKVMGVVAHVGVGRQLWAGVQGGEGQIAGRQVGAGQQVQHSGQVGVLSGERVIIQFKERQVWERQLKPADNFSLRLIKVSSIWSLIISHIESE